LGHLSAASGKVCPVYDAAESFVVGVVVAPDDVTADHAALLLVSGVVGAVEGDVAQGRELRLDAVQPGRICRCIGDLDVVRLGPGPDPAVLAGGQVRAEVVADDRDPGGGRVERAQVAAELQEPGAGLARLDMPVELVLAQLVTVCREWRAREPYATRSGKAWVTAAVRLETCSRS
jgi:hypothetical protein